MRTGRILLRGMVVMMVVMLPVAAPWAGDAETDDGDPTPGHEFESGWNPTFTCEAEEGDTIHDILECLADGIVNPPGIPCPPTTPSTPELPETIGDDPGLPSDLAAGGSGSSGDSGCYTPDDREDFTVYPLPWPRTGIRIIRNDGTEIDKLLLRENDPAIQMTYLEVNREGLVARIGTFVERPSRSGGIVTVSVNGRSVHLNTALYNKTADLTEALQTQLKALQFAVVTMRPYLVVTRDHLSGNGIVSVGFQSTDPDIATSDLALVPPEEIGFEVGPDGPVLRLDSSEPNPGLVSNDPAFRLD